MSSKVESFIKGTLVKAVSGINEFNRKRLPMPDRPHPYLTGIHQPLNQEFTLEDLPITGTIPPALSGRYLRNGPNPAEPANPASYHWFSGAGMVHGLRIENGKALWYRNRWVRGEEACRHLGEPIPSGPRRAGFDAPNTNVVGLGGRTFAIVEAGGLPAELSDDLTTIAHQDFDGTLQGGYTAHPHYDPFTKQYHSVCYRGEEQKKIWHVVLDEAAHVIREQAISVRDGPSIHDCAITQNYVLIFDLPVTFSMKALLSGYSFPYRWNANHPARVGLLPRNGTEDDIIWCAVDPCYVFHPANAYEREDGSVIVDVVAHSNMFAQSQRGPDSEHSALERWTISPATNSVQRETLHGTNQEFPRYDERLTTQSYRYIYSVALAQSATPEMAVNDRRLFRYDLEKRESQTRDFGANRHPGEFIFIPRQAEGAEDDGWLMGLVVDMNSDRTELHILNADDFQGEAQAIIHLPHRIPPGFHGNWVADR